MIKITVEPTDKLETIHYISIRTANGLEELPKVKISESNQAIKTHLIK